MPEGRASIAERVKRKVRSRLTALGMRARDRILPTSERFLGAPPGALARLLTPAPSSWLEQHAEAIFEGAELATEHRFDLLGSGWTRVAYGVACAGTEGHVYPAGRAIHRTPGERWMAERVNAGNAAASVATYRLIDATYEPIDWQLDFKSGYRWSARTYSRDITFGTLPGVDVKVPWELARMQHLATLAHALGLARLRGDALRAETFARECRNQILDFIAANPPRWGVNWTCAMDVGIRIASWLTACDLLRAYGYELDPPFARALAESAASHAAHIVAHLEWSPALRANHYLVDVAGLLVAAAYLPATRETDGWLGFALHELIAAVDEQFGADGGNFEASTSYHRLSAETAVYATAFALAAHARAPRRLATWEPASVRTSPPVPLAPLAMHPIPGSARTSPFPPRHFARVEQMADLTIAATGPDGRVVLIGDNDDGRFLKLGSPLVRTATGSWEEDLRDHHALVAAIDGLVPRTDRRVFAGDGYADRGWVSALAGAPAIAAQRAPLTRCEVIGLSWEDARARAFARARGEGTTSTFRAARGGLRRDIAARAFPEFGLYVLRSPRLLLTVRCGPIGQRGNGGHDHNDQLSMTLVLDGVVHLDDPGTYLYTPIPALRDAYRSAAAHFVPRLVDGREPASFARGLFQLASARPGVCVHFSARGFIGAHDGYGPSVFRVVQVEDDAIIVVDAAEAGIVLAHPTPIPNAPIARGYGRRG